MSVLTVANLVAAHSERRVLDGVSVTIQDGEKVGLVGRNGCGKTTLLRIIAGYASPDEGQVQLARGRRVGYLLQDPRLEPEHTLRREAEQAFADLADLHDKLDALTHRMSEASDQAETERLMRDYDKLERRIEAAGGYAVDHKIDATLHGLGLTDDLFDVKVANLSGGQQARLALAKLLLESPEILLLDEPTNHLDIAGRQWLEQFLKTYNGAVLLVSHDRWLLNEVADRIVEIETGRIQEYPGNYDAYREQRGLRRTEQQRIYARQQTYIRQQEQYIRRYKEGQRAKQARGRASKLDRFKRDELVERPVELDVMSLKLPPARRTGDIVITADDIAKRYDDRTLFEDLQLSIQRGERIGIIGANGCGKSTLADVLMGAGRPDEGKVRHGANVSIGHYRQSHEHLNPDHTPVTHLQGNLPDATDQSARDVAGAFLFSQLDQDKPIGVMSGGERARVSLATLVMGGHNVLVLDEPTNHLDIPSSERLEEALDQYDGTLLLITHDRMLLQDTVDELLIFEPESESGGGGVKRYFGKYADYIAEQRRADREAEAAKKPAPKTAPKPAPRKPRRQSSKNTKFGWLKQDELERRIEQIENELSDLDEKLADPELYRDKDRFRDVHDRRLALAEKLQPLETEWTRRAEAG